MKGISLLICTLAISAITFSQTCPQVSSAYITRLSENTYRVTFNYTGVNVNHFNVSLYSGPVSVSNFLYAFCTGTTSASSTNVDFITTGPNPHAVLVPGGGFCGDANICSQIVVAFGAAGPLPMLISTFNAKRDNNTVLLNWQTQMEINAKEFIVERNTGDGFKPIKTIAATNRAQGDSYSTVDNNTHKNNSLYRLKVVDMDNTYGYSELRMVKGLASDKMDITIYPNPAKSNSIVTIPEITEATDVIIIDNAGRIIRKESVNQGNTFKLGTITPGTYMVKIITRSSGISVTKKLTIN
jgi:hypothetical protein